MNTKTLYYVDDQDDYLATLETELAIIQSDYQLNSRFVGMIPAERFMGEVDKSLTLNDSDLFLIDVNMPTPRELKRISKIWPTNHLGDDQYCGIALAAWLINDNKVQKERIAFITHWNSEQGEHEKALKELKIKFDSDSGAANYFTKDGSPSITKWNVL